MTAGSDHHGRRGPRDADQSILAELTAHAQWLGTVVTQMQGGIQPIKGTGVIPEGSSYYYWVQMADTVSGNIPAAAYQSDQVFSSSRKRPPNCPSWRPPSRLKFATRSASPP